MTKLVRVASLRPQMAATYESMHRAMSSERRAHIAAAGYQTLDIYRMREMLVMLVDHRPELTAAGYEPDPVFDAEWHAATGACFAETWHDAHPIFSISSSCRS